MFTVTTAALDRLSRKLTGKKAEDDQAFRFTRKTSGWKLHLDCARPADAAFSHKGRSVLLLDGAASQAMTGMKLDTRRTDSGPRLRLRKAASGKD